jgi:flavodoxin
LNTEHPEGAAKMSKILVLFYSYEGSTRKIAERIATSIDADIEEIKPVNEMKSKGFSKYVWGGSQVVMKKRPELMPLKVDLDQYDTILLGTPVWAGTFTPPIYSLLENGSLKNKKIACFYCHLGGADKAVARARAAIEKDNTLLSTYSCTNVPENYESQKDEVVSWAKEIVNK